MSIEIENSMENLEYNSDASENEISSSNPVVEVIGQTVEPEEPESKKKRSKRAKKHKKVHEPSEREIELKKIVFGDREGFLKRLEGKSYYRDVDTDANEQSKPSVWQDSDDEIDSNEIGGKKLKRKFERISGNPSWAKPEKQTVDSDEEYIVRTVGHLDTSKSNKSGSLVKGSIDFKRLKDLNRATYSEGLITSVEFHPGSTVGIVSGSKGITSIYAIDGRENKKIHNIRYENFNISCAKLSKDGEELISGGKENFYYSYNLLSGQSQRVRLPKNMTTMKSFEISPCGKFIGVVGRFGEIHLLDIASKELICSLKQEYNCSSIKFTPDSTKLLAHSNDSEVTIFDLKMERVIHKFVDEGCVNGQDITISPNGKLLATGSRQGVVNIYEYDKVFQKKYPVAEKSIMNLTTEITKVLFNPLSELLAICSKESKNGVKLVHLPSGTVFSNFPNNQDDIGYANTLAFSPSGGYFSIGTQKKIPLYRLRHYSNY